jgi:hypothetical protein
MVFLVTIPILRFPVPTCHLTAINLSIIKMVLHNHTIIMQGCRQIPNIYIISQEENKNVKTSTVADDKQQQQPIL